MAFSIVNAPWQGSVMGEANRSSVMYGSAGGSAGYGTPGYNSVSRAKAGAAGGGGAVGGDSVSAVAGLFGPDGLPTRLPRNAKEAMLFQLQATRMARQQQQRQTAAALSSLRYGLGMTQRQSPYGLGYLMSPLLSQMAQTQERVQYDPGDYSYFVRGGSGAGGFGGMRSGGLFSVRGAPAVGMPGQAGQAGGLQWQNPAFAGPQMNPMAAGGGGFSGLGYGVGEMELGGQDQQAGGQMTQDPNTGEWVPYNPNA